MGERIMTLIDRIKKHEGFVGTSYDDSLGIPTIGYGTRLPLTKQESEMILVHRLNQKIDELTIKKPIVLRLSKNLQDALYEMAYQMGVDGLIKFKNMWIAIEQEDYKKASVEALDSLWAKQTPHRAKKIAKIISEG